MQNVKEVIMNALELLLPRTYTTIIAHKFWLNNETLIVQLTYPDFHVYHTVVTKVASVFLLLGGITVIRRRGLFLRSSVVCLLVCHTSEPCKKG